MVFLAWILCYSVRVDMSVAIVAMVNHTAVNSLQPNTTTLNIEDNSVEDTTNVGIFFFHLNSNHLKM